MRCIAVEATCFSLMARSWAMWSVFTWACCWAPESRQNGGSGVLLQKSGPRAGEQTVGDQKHHVFHGEISLIMFQCVFF